MNKKIAVISGFKGTNDAIEQGFIDIFGNDYELEGIIYPDDIEKSFGDYDMFICSSYYIITIMEQKISRKIPIVLADRNLDMESVSKLLSIKSGTVIYVSGSNKQGALEVINLLEDIGINHLTLLPYYEQFEVSESDIVISITPAPYKLTHNRVIEAGFDTLNIYTLMNIFVKLQMPPEKLLPILQKYAIDESISNNHISLMNQNLQGILEIVSDGILCIDKAGRTIFCNKAFSELLGLDYFDLISKNYKDIDFEQSLLNIIYREIDVLYEVINYNDKKLIVNKQNIPNSINGFILSIQNVTHIQALETNVRKKLMDKGFTAKYTLNHLIGQSAIIKTKINEVKKIAKNNFAILLQGNNGTGKEMFAQAIHNESHRAKHPFVAINLASLSDNLVESELFGYEEGSFTGAIKGGKAGLFEMAHNGTIFIDEIGDVSPHIQQRLLRVLQEKEIMRVGGNRIIPIDVRVISATNKDLYKLVEEGEFRKDLYYRIKVLHINLPDLKYRTEDISLFVRYFFDTLNSTKYLNKKAISILENYSWPGNVRELQNLVYYLETLCENDEITPEDIPVEYKSYEQILIPVHKEYDDILSLYNQNTLDEFQLILENIYNFNSQNISIGKIKLHNLLLKSNIKISVEQIRNRLVKLNNHGFVITRKTRQGSEITQDGISFLKYLENKI